MDLTGLLNRSSNPKRWRLPWLRMSCQSLMWKLTNAAQQFEGMLLQEMLKPMKEHGFCQEDGDDSQDQDGGSGFADTLSSFVTMATAIAKGGGLGIAKRVVEQVEGEKAAHSQRVAGKG